MIRLPVESSDIVSIGYDEPSQSLEVEFHGGRVYVYSNVPPEMHAQFLAADSHGYYFNTFIQGHFRYQRVEDGKTKAPTALAFVSGNTRKLRDLQLACEQYGIEVEQLKLEVDEIQSDDPEEIAVKKAKAAYKMAGRPVVVNDTYWDILALRGFPGAYMSSMVGWLKPEEFLRLMEDKTDRTIICTDTLVYYDGKQSKVFSWQYRGKIATEPRGNVGLSIDRIVIMDGYDRTIAQVEEQEGRSSDNPDGSVWRDFAKWYNVQRRLGRA
jgi:XTP/dITP diphosphohydrolase